MPLGREDFRRALGGEPIDIPLEHFGPPPERGPEWPDFPELRAATDWLKRFMQPGEWEQRRRSIYIRFYASAFNLGPLDEAGRFFDAADMSGWYLFLAEAFLDHCWNYEPLYGSRVIPALAAIGRNLPLLERMEGVDDRVRRLVHTDQRQPNGVIFEMLVAAAYGRAGGEVSFRPETPGRGRSWDLDVRLGGKDYAVECKRMEVGQYGDRERNLMRRLWHPPCEVLVKARRSSFCDVNFTVPLSDVSEAYLLGKAAEWQSSGRPSLLWNDSFSSGVIGELDLSPLQAVLKDHEVMVSSTRLHELLTGRYIRHASHIQITRHRVGISPRYMSECDLAVLARWKSSSDAAITAKARDVLRKLAEAADQLPSDRMSIVHIGFEAVEGDDVERARHEKILKSTASFDAGGKPLSHVYCHYFVPESPPDQAWAFDETIQWQRISGEDPRPLREPFLILPEGEQARRGPHWR
jgi:hypothetical protein